jgi:hypothetical protein
VKVLTSHSQRQILTKILRAGVTNYGDFIFSIGLNFGIYIHLLSVRKFLKRIFDIFVSLPMTVLLLPVFAVIVIAVRVSSKGPAVFKQERAGKDGAPFTFYKFRTMKLDVDQFGTS